MQRRRTDWAPVVCEHRPKDTTAAAALQIFDPKQNDEQEILDEQMDPSAFHIQSAGGDQRCWVSGGRVRGCGSPGDDI